MSGTQGSFSGDLVQFSTTKTRETTKTIDVTETYTRVRDLLQFSEGASIYGQPIVRGAGTRMAVGVPIWYGEDTGNFTFDFAVSLGAPLAANTKFLLVRRIWLDDELVLDRSGTGSAAPKRRNLKFTVHAGTETEAVDPTIASQAGNDIPAFRGQNTIVIRELNLKDWGFETLPVVRVEYSEQSSYQPSYKNMQTPSSVADLDDVDSYGTVIIPNANEAVQIYSLGVGEYMRICTWDTRSGLVKRDNILTFRGSPLASDATTSFGEDMVYHPHMDRVIFCMPAGVFGIVNNTYIVNHTTGEIDDCTGYYPKFSAAHRHIENRLGVNRPGRNPRDEAPVYNWNRDFRYGLSVNYPDEAKEGYSTFIPYLWRTQEQKDEKLFPTNDMGENLLGVNTKIACCGNPDAPKPYINIEYYEEVAVSNSSGGTNNVYRLAADPWKREYATFSLFEGRPYHAGGWWDICCFKVKENGVFYWMVCFTQQHSTGGGSCTSITYLNNSEYVVGATSKLLYGNRAPGQYWADAFSLDLQYTPEMFYNYVGYGAGDRSFYCLHSTFAGTTGNRVRRTYRINVGMISGAVNSSAPQANTFSFVPGSAKFYNQTRTAAIEVVWDNTLTDSEIGDAVKFGATSPDVIYDYYRDDRTATERYHLEGNRFYEGVVNGPQAKLTLLPKATDEDGVDIDRDFNGGGNYTYAVQVYEGKFFSGMIGGAPARRFSIYGTTEGEPLANLLRALAEDIGFASGDIIIEGIDDTYWGSIISTTTDFWSLVNDLGLLYSFEAFESQGKIKFVKNSVSEDQPVAYALTHDDLAPLAAGDVSKQADNDPNLIVTRANETDIPKRVNLTFIDYNDEYRSSQVYTRRQNTTDLNEDDGTTYSMTVPICMSIKEATTRASNVLFDAWNDRVVYQVRLPKSYMLVEPGDMLSYTGAATIYEYDEDGEVTITTRDTSMVIRSVSCTLNADWSTSIQGKSYFKSSTPTITIEPPITRPEDQIKDNNNVQVYLLNIPLLKTADDIEAVDADNGLIMQEVCYIVTDRDDFTYIDIYRLSNTSTEIMGRSNAIMTAGILFSRLAPVTCPFAIYEESIEINMGAGYDQDLIPVPTEDEFMAGTHLVALRGLEGWDIISYRDVQFKESTVVLTGIIRGRRGSEYHAQRSDIAVGSPVVFLDGGHTLQTLYDAAEYRAPITVSSVPPNAREVDISTDSGYIMGIRHKPFAPVHIQVTNAVDGVDISWIRRSRATSTLNNGVPVPPAFFRELRAYEVAVFADDNNVPVIVKDVTDAETVNITDAELVDAGVDGQTQLRVSVSQRPEKTAVDIGLNSPIAYYDIIDPA